MAGWFRLRDSGTVQRPPFGEACVCVPLVVTGIQSDCANFFVFQQGDCLACNSGSPTKRLLQVTDMDSGRRIHVPANLLTLGNGTLGRRVAPLSSQYAYP